MRAKEMLFESLRAAFGNRLDGNARGVRGNNRIRLADFINARHQVLLDLEIFHNSLTDPICVRDRAKIIFKISKRDESLQVRAH